ncbi:MAG: PQQ-binding-like beta-propeller repeat protein [Prolixibacteraceae bacterium]|nr:PQQ-binding-like beta-propeller repeat protein [Prolixibacteraceae bacterium]
MKSKFSLVAWLIFISIFFGCNHFRYENNNWTHFRGTNLDGMAENENIPVNWDESVIQWKTEIHDRGHSSPVVYNDQIWLTTGTAGGNELYAVCIDFNTGGVIHDIKVFSQEEVERKHSLNTYASPTPCIEKNFVYVHYGSMGTACINTKNGSVVWKRTDLKCQHHHGPGSSPVIYKNLLILHFEGVEERYIVALDKSNGEIVWRTDRPAEPYERLSKVGSLAYLTPIIINVKGRDMLISNGSAVCSAYDPKTGEEIWMVVDGAETTVAMPFTEDGVLFWYTGYDIGADGKKYTDLLAVNPDGKGDITDSHIIWKKVDESLDNQMLSPVIKDGLIYTVTTMNIMMCIDATTGEEIWTKRVNSRYNASPINIDGCIWFFTVNGEVLVLKEGREYEVVAENKMESGIWATPAVLRNTMILRTQNYLYRIGTNKKNIKERV